MKGFSNKISDFLAEKLYLRELSTKQQNAIAAALSGKERDEIVSKIKKSDEDILNQYPPGFIAQEIRSKILVREKSTKTKKPIHFLGYYGLAAAVMFSLAVIFWFKTQPVEEYTGYKGAAPILRIYLKTETGYTMLKEGDLVKEKNLLQLRYIAMDKKFGVIYSLDGNGEITRHFPLPEKNMAELMQGKEVALDHSYELDNAPLFERFFFVTSDIPLDPALVREKIALLAKEPPEKQQQQKLDLPGQDQQFSLNLRKTK